MWGYTARDSFTIPSLVAAELKRRGIDGVEVENLAQPGYGATQDVISLLLALRDGQAPAAAVFLTTHKDIYAAFQAGHAGGITSEAVYASLMEPREPSFSEHLEAVGRRSALVSRVAPPPIAPSSYANADPRPELCDDVAQQYRELARVTAALGRTLLLSDQKQLDAARAKLAADGYAFGSLVESIVTSPQFLNKRGRDDVRE